MSQPQQQQRTVEDIAADLKWWYEFSPKNWVVAGLIYRTSARLVKVIDDSYLDSVSLEPEHVMFIKEIIAEKDREIDMLKGAIKFETERADGLADEVDALLIVLSTLMREKDNVK